MLRFIFKRAFSTVPTTTNKGVIAFAESTAKIVKPKAIHWVTGSADERAKLTAEAVKQGILSPLDQKAYPNCYLHRSNPNDVARVENLTFICTPTKDEAGPTNNWMEPSLAYKKVGSLLEGAMQDRTMYVIPYIMGPPGSPFAKVGIEITDSIYVVLNMGIMTRMGDVALKTLGPEGKDFNKGIHSTLDCNPERRYICHFPQDNAIWSVGSGYGGNVLLGKKCLALRIGSYLGQKEGWLAEHMLILGVQNPAGETKYVAAAFPSACGKTNFAMMVPPASFDGWKVFTVGDDIAWMRVGEDGRLWACNPENGYFGVAPGTSEKSNPAAMKVISRDTIFTNVAVKDNKPYWEGMGRTETEGVTNWKGEPHDPNSKEPAAHPNSRFTSPMQNNPFLSPKASDPQGVPISAIIFGGRRPDTVPLVLESFNWTHGVYMGATMGSATTAAATGNVGVIRRDPMAMLPFCGYDMGKYFKHWLDMSKKIKNPPKIFMVNWFRKDKDGKGFLWPGYGENMRVLKWAIDRVDGKTAAKETPVGFVPIDNGIELKGLDKTDKDNFSAATHVSMDEWAKELESHKEFFAGIPTTPKALLLQREILEASVKSN